MTGPIGVMGLGYVGLPLVVAFAREGVEVIAYDIDQARVDALSRSVSFVEDVSDSDLEQIAPRLRATTDPADLAAAAAVLVCVPTPLTRNREPDLGPLASASETLAGVVRAGQLVVIESTTYPGTTRELVAPVLERSGLEAGMDFHLAFSPERIDPGRTDHTLRTTPKVVGGLTEACGRVAHDVYATICDEVVDVSTVEVAELSKLLENIYRSVNIALVNELAILCGRMDIDVWEVIDAASTKPYGFQRFEPGPGMGGHCLPVDPFYLSWRARQFDMSAEFIELAGRINQGMPHYCVSRVSGRLNELGRPIAGSKVAILGVSYKGGIGDVRESPALKIITLLRAAGAQVVFHDSYVARLAEHDLDGIGLDEALDGADIAVLVTAHPDVDHDAIARSEVPLLDLRGRTRALTDAPMRTTL